MVLQTAMVHVIVLVQPLLLLPLPAQANIYTCVVMITRSTGFKPFTQPNTVTSSTLLEVDADAVSDVLPLVKCERNAVLRQMTRTDR